MIFFYFCICMNLYKLEGNKLHMLILVPYFVLTVILSQQIARHFPVFIEMILTKKKENKKFKQIFDNFDETTLIINKTKCSLQYVNNCFYAKFKELLYSFPHVKFELDHPDLNDSFLKKKMFKLSREKENNELSI